MNDTLKTIRQRYSCRSFDGKMPDDESLNAIAQAAIEAPSGVNRQHWHIIMLKNSTLISQMEEEGMRLLSLMPDKSMHERILSRGGKLFYNAPCMAVIAIKEAAPKGAELIDLGIVAQNIVLAASSLGIANVHCGLAALCFAGGKATEFKEKLHFPQNYEFGIAVLLGYATAPTVPHTPDKSKVSFVTGTEYELKTLEDYIAYWNRQSVTMLRTICQTYGVDYKPADNKADLVKKLTAGMEKRCEENRG